MKKKDSSIHPSSSHLHPSKAASAELEVEVTYLLDQIKANLGEQMSLARTAGGAYEDLRLSQPQVATESMVRTG